MPLNILELLSGTENKMDIDGANKIITSFKENKKRTILGLVIIVLFVVSFKFLGGIFDELGKKVVSDNGKKSAVDPIIQTGDITIGPQASVIFGDNGKITFAVVPPAKLENQRQENYSMDTIPDVSKAKREVLITSKEQLNSTSILFDVSKYVSGYFELPASPTSSRYSYSCAKTIDIFKPHYYASARIKGLEGSTVLDFGGRGVYFGLHTKINGYYIYESEENWTTWRRLKSERADQIDTLSIYQKGRNVSVFLNGDFLSTFTKLKKAEPGPISISFKADYKTGGRIHFQKLSIWEF